MLDGRLFIEFAALLPGEGFVGVFGWLDSPASAGSAVVMEVSNGLSFATLTAAAASSSSFTRRSSRARSLCKTETARSWESHH